MFIRYGLAIVTVYSPMYLYVVHIYVRFVSCFFCRLFETFFSASVERRREFVAVGLVWSL